MSSQSPERSGDGSSPDEGSSEDVADDVIIDGRISGPPPRYEDDDPSAHEAQEQEDEQAQE